MGWEVRLVEAEDVGCAFRDGGCSVGLPVGKVVWAGVPEHGDEVHGGGDVASWLGVPVVAPADLGAFEEGGESGGVVDETTGDDVATAGGGRGSRRRCRGGGGGDVGYR